LFADSYRRFCKTKEYVKLLEKFKDDQEVVITTRHKTFPYSNQDFCQFIITEKDIGLLDELSEDSLDYKLCYSTNKNGMKANAYYSTSVSKYLPLFKWSEGAVCSKIELITNENLNDAFKIYYSFINTPVIFYLKMKGIFSYESKKIF
jgi:hypothetical protein